VTISRGMAQQTLMHIFQLAEGYYLFYIYKNYKNLFFFIGKKEKRMGDIFSIGINLS